MQNISTLMKNRCASAPEGVQADLAIDIATVRDAFRPGDRWIWFIHQLGTALLRPEDADLNSLACLSRKEGVWLAIEVDKQDPMKGSAEQVAWKDIRSMVIKEQSQSPRQYRQQTNEVVYQIAGRVAGMCQLGSKEQDQVMNSLYELLGGARIPGEYLVTVNKTLGRIDCVNTEKGVVGQIEYGEHMFYVEVLSDVRYGRWLDAGEFAGLH